MTESVTLSPLTPIVESPPASRRGRWVDALLAGLVLTFAFLAASFAARNSDLWMHLASGRLLARGKYTFGTDPFSYTTAGTYWANHAWLFDLLFYLGYQKWGGPALVVLKALVVAGLAALMLRLARSSARPYPFWVSAGCILLAVLAMSPRLLLQPACLSLLFLAVCLALLRAGGRALLWLPGVVALWVNVDSWFILGPLVVALYAVGQALTPRTPDSRLPRWLFPACLGACLLSPHHVHALTLPTELHPAVWTSDLRHDVRFAPLFASPWRLAPLGSAGGYSLSAWAFFVLLTLSLVSFGVNRSALRNWRLPVWLAFALLAAWQVRLVPFFAVVAGPITALNLGERLSEQTLPRAGRTAVLLAGLVLLALTWPGWLHGFHRHDRPVAWSIPPDPSLRRVTATLHQWRQQGILPADVRTFATHPDVAHYCAWFCPEEKGFLDSRLSLFLPVAADFERLCLTLDRNSPSSDWQHILRDRNIAALVVYDPDLRRLAPALREIAQSPRRWNLVRVDGQAVVVGWKEAPTGSLASMSFHAERAAFTAAGDDAVPPAPDVGPPLLPQPLPWWERYLERPSGSAWEADAAAVYLRLFEDGGEEQRQRQREAVLSRYAAGLTGLPTAPTAVYHL